MLTGPKYLLCVCFFLGFYCIVSLFILYFITLPVPTVGSTICAVGSGKMKLSTSEALVLTSGIF